MSSQTCPNCGWLNRATNRFCSNCGGAIVPSTPAPAESTGAVLPTQPTAPIATDASSATTPTGEPVSGSAADASAFTPPSASTADTQPVTYAVKRWEAEATPTEPESGQPFTPPSPQAGWPAPTIPIAPPPVPPGTYPYGAAQGDLTGLGTASSASAAAMPHRSEGGTYLPYSTEAARHLETKKNSRSWLIPSIIVAAVALLVIGSVAAFLVLNGQRAANPTSQLPTTQEGTQQLQCSDLLSKLESGGSGSDNEDTLRGIICKSNDEQIKAWRELDTEILKGTRTGQALEENIQAVLDLRNKGLYALPDNKSIEFGEVKFEGDKATAKTVEVWTVTFYSKSDNRVVLPPQGPDTLRETYHFVKIDGKWLITSVDIVPNEPPITPGTTDT